MLDEHLTPETGFQAVCDARDAVGEALARGDVQRCVSVQVDGRQRTASVQNQFSDLSAARERRPVQANIHLLYKQNTHWKNTL